MFLYLQRGWWLWWQHRLHAKRLWQAVVRGQHRNLLLQCQRQLLLLLLLLLQVTISQLLLMLRLLLLLV